VFFGDQALEARFRSSENDHRNNAVVDNLDFKIETVGLERVANWLQCRLDRFCHFNLNASLKKFVAPLVAARTSVYWRARNASGLPQCTGLSPVAAS
jgi:hypothetical protein